MDPKSLSIELSFFERLAGAIHNDPYEFVLQKISIDSVVPASVDAAIYSDIETSLAASIGKHELKSGLLADTFLLQFSEGAGSTAVVDDGGAWDAPQGLIYYEPRSITLAKGMSGKYIANFPIEAKLISSLAGEVEAATGKIIYVRVVAVKARTTVEKKDPQRRSIGRSGIGSGAAVTGAPGRDGGRLTLPQLGRSPELGRSPQLGRLPQTGRSPQLKIDLLNLPRARDKWQLVSNPSPWRAVYIAGDKAAVDLLVAQKKQAALTADLERAANEIASRYKVEILSYVPPKFNDDLTSGAFAKELELTRDVSFKGRNWKKGQLYDPNAAGNILQKTGAKSLPSDFYNLATGVIDQTSNGWKSAKGFAVGTIADGLNGSGIVDCGATCKAAITIGLNVALAYCGIPPSIPNSRELFEGGKSYIAGAVADAIFEQATGVDSDAFNALAGDALKKQARKKLMGAVGSGIDRLATEMGCPAPGAPDCGFKADSPYTWGVPSAYFQKRPGVVWIKISRVKGASTEESPGYIGVNLQRVPGTSGRKTVNIFQPILPLRLFEIPDEGLVVPVLLLPSVDSSKDNLWNRRGFVNPNWEDGIPETYHGQPFYDNGSQLLNGKITIVTTHLVTSQHATYPQVVAKKWIVDKFLDLARPYDGIDGKIMNGYFGEIPYNRVP
ncbi:MAG: hypothetical protein WKF34_05900 [Pyrinomonadaceae bacterium]